MTRARRRAGASLRKRAPSWLHGRSLEIRARRRRRWSHHSRRQYFRRYRHRRDASRHGAGSTPPMSYTKLSVGDGLVSQIPALIVSLAAGLLVSKGGTRGPADEAVLGQLGRHPRALFVAAMLMALLAIDSGSALLSVRCAWRSDGVRWRCDPKTSWPRPRPSTPQAEKKTQERRHAAADKERQSVKEHLRPDRDRALCRPATGDTRPRIARRSLTQRHREDAPQVRDPVWICRTGNQTRLTV